MHNEIINQLSAYLDGELSPSERARIDEHIAACAACRVVLDDLKAIVVTAPYYEGEAPKRDVWAGIQAGISGQKEVAFDRRPSTVDRRRFSLGQLIAASVAFAAVVGGGVYFAVRPSTVDGRPSTDGGPSTVAQSTSPVDRRPSTAPELATISNKVRAGEVYDAAVGDLERVLAEGKNELDPRTLKVIEENLRIIDRAIAEARSAIAADPANAYLRSQVAANMRRKLDILRQATDVIRAASET
ncbi:MAG TPA: zf-HC2 domain-containing protein [Gemmatimonadales bacterium]|nr:zf-HC2 domain-containing protein [Gemmatimonadales bacterium]